MGYRQQPCEKLLWTHRNAPSQVIFRPNPAKPGFLGCLLREIFACKRAIVSPPQRPSDEPGFHAINRGLTWGEHIAKNAGRHWWIRIGWRPDLLGNRVAWSHGES
jgi:hypothetical protein